MTHEGTAYHRNGEALRHSQNLIDREGKEEYVSAGLSIKGAGLVAGNIELDVFLIDSLVAVHAILLRIVIHGVVPPVEQGIGLCSVDGVAVAAAGIILN
jgi:hypothetical protein